MRCELARWPRGASPEPAARILGQVLVPVLLSGLGVVAAGLLMNRVQVRMGRLRAGRGPGSGAGRRVPLGTRAPEVQSA